MAETYFHDLIGRFTYDPKNKPIADRQKCVYMLNRTQQMFVYDGLPDTLPKRFFELQQQTAGHTTVFRTTHGDIVCDVGGFGGYPDGYRMPTRMVIANPVFGSYDLEIGKDCVLARNDTCMIGLLPLFSRYASAMTENELSIRNATILLRAEGFFKTPSDNTREAMDAVMRKIESGELAIGIADPDWMNGITSLPFGDTSRRTALSDLIEMEQYLKASWFNELGLNANYNMKRESLNSTESQMNNDALLPLVDDMFECRKQAVREINEMFGTGISVRLSSAWEDNLQEIELEHQRMSGGDGNANE